MISSQILVHTNPRSAAFQAFLAMLELTLSEPVLNQLFQSFLKWLSITAKDPPDHLYAEQIALIIDTFAPLVQYVDSFVQDYINFFRSDAEKQGSFVFLCDF